MINIKISIINHESNTILLLVAHANIISNTFSKRIPDIHICDNRRKISVCGSAAKSSRESFDAAKCIINV